MPSGWAGLAASVLRGGQQQQQQQQQQHGGRRDDEQEQPLPPPPPPSGAVAYHGGPHPMVEVKREVAAEDYMSQPPPPPPYASSSGGYHQQQPPPPPPSEQPGAAGSYLQPQYQQPPGHAHSLSISSSTTSSISSSVPRPSDHPLAPPAPPRAREAGGRAAGEAIPNAEMPSSSHQPQQAQGGAAGAGAGAAAARAGTRRPRPSQARPLHRLSVQLIDTYKAINTAYYEKKARRQAAEASRLQQQPQHSQASRLQQQPQQQQPPQQPPQQQAPPSSSSSSTTSSKAAAAAAAAATAASGVTGAGTVATGGSGSTNSSHHSAGSGSSSGTLLKAAAAAAAGAATGAGSLAESKPAAVAGGKAAAAAAAYAASMASSSATTSSAMSATSSTASATAVAGTKGVYNNGWDDENYDYILEKEEVLLERYVVKNRIGKGSFGQVVRGFDKVAGVEVAIKIIKSRKPFMLQAKTEIELLEHLKEKDGADEHNLVRLLDHFVHRGHQCLIFEMLSYNLYDLLKYTKFHGVSLTLLRKFAKQILKALAFLAQKDVDIIHCDLKPENILLRHPKRSGIKVIDFGSSCRSNKRMYSYIQSRFYRSPEVMMGLPYSVAIDMWSLGCVLVEMHTGEPLFGGVDQFDQMRRIIEVLGMPPSNMLEASPSTSRDQFFEPAGPRQWRIKDSPAGGGSGGSGSGPTGAPAVGGRLLSEVIGVGIGGPNGRRAGEPGHTYYHYCAFLDLVQKMLHYDPALRITPSEALKHPFLTQEGDNLGPVARGVATGKSDAATTAEKGTLTAGATAAGNSSGARPSKSPRVAATNATSSLPHGAHHLYGAGQAAAATAAGAAPLPGALAAADAGTQT